MYEGKTLQEEQCKSVREKGLKEEDCESVIGKGKGGRLLLGKQKREHRQGKEQDWEDMLNEEAYNGESNKEAIVIQLLNAPESGSGNSIQNSWENGLRVKSQGGSGGIAVPRDMIDLFPMADGSRPTLNNGYDSFLRSVPRRRL